ncbi:MAG: hypothetical protein GVY17_03175 [Cyanobacteria bacterium]|jgi:hypothetical protein|nr:hypothetical protein [Cyanobacteria bacterium GSL.Bin21]
MIGKKLAFGLIATVAFASPAAAQAEQSQTSLQQVQSQNAAVNGSAAITDTDLNNRQAQFERDGFYGYDGYDRQEQLSIQDANTSNAAVNGSTAITDTDLNNRQSQFERDGWLHRFGY